MKKIVKIILALVILYFMMTGAGEREDGTMAMWYPFTALAIIWACGYIWRALDKPTEKNNL